MVGMIDTIIGVIPGPGGALVEGLTAGFEKDLVKNIINTSYGELIDRGLALVETSHEGAARAGAEDFRAALTGRMEELLVVAIVDAHVGVTDSIEAFLATDAASGLDASFWDPGTGFLTDEISRRVAYNEWYEWVGHEYPSIVSAVTVYLTQLQSELPVWSD
jgi:hypothetical protein